MNIKRKTFKSDMEELAPGVLPRNPNSCDCDTNRDILPQTRTIKLPSTTQRVFTCGHGRLPATAAVQCALPRPDDLPPLCKSPTFSSSSLPYCVHTATVLIYWNLCDS